MADVKPSALNNVATASRSARRWAFRTVLKLRSTKLWRKMSSPTANCRLFGNLQYGHSPRRSQFVGDFGAGRPRSIADCPGRWRRERNWDRTFSTWANVLQRALADVVRSKGWARPHVPAVS